MPPPEHASAIHDIVLWPVNGWDEQGRFLVGDPVQVRGRWNTVKTQALDRQGNRITLDGHVYQLSQAAAVGSLLWKGTLLAWYGPGGSSGNDTGLVEVKVDTETPDIKGRQVHYDVGFVYYGNKLPGR